MKKIMILAAALALSACFGDKGNYDYHPLPEVTITSMADIPAYAGEELPFTPEVTFAEGDSESNYEFHWMKTSPAPSEPIRKEGKTLLLNETTVERQIWMLFVTNKATQVSTTQNFYFNVQAAYGRGWLLLADDGGSTTLHYIRPEYEDPTTKLIRKFVSFPSASTGLGTQPKQLWQNLGGANPWPILIAQGSGDLSINGGTLLRELDLSEEFVGGMPTGFHLKQYVTLGIGGSGPGLNHVLSEDGNTYVREGAGDDFVNEFTNFPVEYQGAPLKVERLIDTRAYSGSFICVGLVDAVNKRVMWQNADNRLMNQRGIMVPSVMAAPVGVVDADVFDFTNFGDKTLLWVDLYPPGGALRMFYKKGADYYIQNTSIAANRSATVQVTVTPTRNEKFAGAEFLSDDTKFFQLETRDMLFFANGNKLYLYYPAPNTVHLIHTFAAGENVVAMASNPQESELGCYLSNGSFVAVNISTAKLLDGEITGRIDALPGTPVSMVYKFLAPYGYSQRARGGTYND